MFLKNLIKLTYKKINTHKGNWGVKMARLKKKTLLISFVVIVVIFFISFATVKAIKSKNNKGIPVKTAKIEKQDIKSNIFTSGVVVSKEERQVASDLTRKVIEILVEEGDKVTKGQMLAKLDASELEYQLKDAEINLEISKDKLQQLSKQDKASLETTFKNAEIFYNELLKNYEDKKSLYEAGAISKNDLNTAKSSMERAYNEYILAKKNYENADDLSEIRIQEKQIKALELRIAKIKEDIEKTNITSPIDGTITKVNASELSIVSPNMVLFNIQDIENLEVVTNISEYDISKVKLGQLVKITGDGIGKEEYEGVIKYISPHAESIRNGQSTETVVEVKIDIKDKDTEFKPNFTANIEINTANKKGVLVVPYEAIYTNKDGTKSIFIVEDDKAKKINIETGIEGDMVVEVIGEGFKEGDLVILNPTEKIEDGSSVKVNRGSKE